MMIIVLSSLPNISVIITIAHIQGGNLIVFLEHFQRILDLNLAHLRLTHLATLRLSGHSQCHLRLTSMLCSSWATGIVLRLFTLFQSEKTRGRIYVSLNRLIESISNCSWVSEVTYISTTPPLPFTPTSYFHLYLEIVECKRLLKTISIIPSCLMMIFIVRIMIFV